MPVFWLGEVVNLVTQSRLHDTWLFSWVPPLGYTPLTAGSWRLVQGPGHPVADARRPLYRPLRAGAARQSGRGADRRTSSAPRGPRASARRRILLRHALRTSLITFVTLFGLDFGALVGGGALLTEVVFGLQGVGQADL